MHTVSYAISGGLNGKARAALADGSSPHGKFVVDVASAPPHKHLNPETGQVAPGPLPVSPGPVGAVP
jgi:hypothetical protein